MLKSDTTSLSVRHSCMSGLNSHHRHQRLLCQKSAIFYPGPCTKEPMCTDKGEQKRKHQVCSARTKKNLFIRIRDTWLSEVELCTRFHRTWPVVLEWLHCHCVYIYGTTFALTASSTRQPQSFCKNHELAFVSSQCCFGDDPDRTQNALTMNTYQRQKQQFLHAGGWTAEKWSEDRKNAQIKDATSLIQRNFVCTNTYKYYHKQHQKVISFCETPRIFLTTAHVYLVIKHLLRLCYESSQCGADRDGRPPLPKTSCLGSCVIWRPAKYSAKVKPCAWPLQIRRTPLFCGHPKTLIVLIGLKHVAIDENIVCAKEKNWLVCRDLSDTYR